MKNLIFILSLVLTISACKQDKLTTQAAPVTKTEADASTQGNNTAPKVMTEATLDLTQYGISRNPNNVLGGLKVGDLAPNFTAATNRGRDFNLEEATGRYPIVLTFFRGGWCGYCTKHLAEFSDNMKALQNLGHARVVAVTPQTMDYVRDVVSKEKLSYSLISDTDH